MLLVNYLYDYIGVIIMKNKILVDNVCTFIKQL